MALQDFSMNQAKGLKLEMHLTKLNRKVHDCTRQLETESLVCFV